MSRRPRPEHLAVASVGIGVAGLILPLVAPLAIYLARISSRSETPRSRADVVLSRIGLVLGLIGSAFLAVLLLIVGVQLFVSFGSKGR